MLVFHRFRTVALSFLLSFFFYSCAGQTAEKFPVRVTVTHQDSISARAETLPEYRVSVHDRDYQGNQISGVIRTVFQDSKGNYWFGTQSGLCRYDKIGLVYFELKGWDGKGVTVYVILEDKAGNIWIGYDGGISKYDGTHFTEYHEKDILTKGGLWSMAIDKKGLLWVGTTQGVFTFDGEALSPFEIPEGKVNPDLGISTAKMIHGIMEDSKGNMWFATNGGAYMYDGTALKSITEKDGLLSDFVNRIIEGGDGNFWISTYKGLNQYNGSELVNVTESVLENGVGIGCMLEDKSGILWFSVNKRDIYQYDGKSFTKTFNKEDDFSPFPFQIYQDRQERLWFVGFKGAYRLEQGAFVNVTRDGPW